MSAWGWVGISCVSYVALVVGYCATVEYFRHRNAQHTAPRRCHFCDLYPARTDDAWCSAICADNDLGLSKVKP